MIEDEEKADILRTTTIRNTYSGTTILLSPVDISSDELSFPRSHLEAFVHSLVYQTAHKVYNDTDCYYRYEDPEFHDPFADDYDVACIEYYARERERFTKDLLTSIAELKYGGRNKFIVFVYDPEAENAQKNTHIFESFLGTVATLETISEPMYDRPLDADSNHQSPYRIVDPLSNNRRHAISLLRFVGNNLVSFAVDELFRENLQPWDLVDTEEPPEISTIPKTEFEMSSIWELQRGSAFDEMRRSFVCIEGGNSGVALREIDRDTVLLSARSVICQTGRSRGKGIIDLTDTLTKDWDLYRKVDLIISTDTRNVLDARLKELHEIQLLQLAALESVHKYVAMRSFDTRINAMKEQLRILKSQKSGAFEHIVGMASAIASVQAGAGGFIGGLEAVKGLMKNVPTDSWSAAKDYFEENREDFSEARHTTTSNAAGLISGVNEISRILKGRQTGSEIGQLKDAIAKLRRRRELVVAGINKNIEKAEGAWRNKVEQVFNAELAEQSLGRNVALILEDAVANKLVNGLGTKNFGQDMRLCVASFENYLDGAGNFNPIPVENGCGVNSSRLTEIKRCVRESQGESNHNLVSERMSKVILLADTAEAARCFSQ